MSSEEWDDDDDGFEPTLEVVRIERREVCDGSCKVDCDECGGTGFQEE